MYGKSKPPGAVTGFTPVYDDNLGLTLDWADNPERDIAAYELRRATGAALPASDWDTATAVKRVTLSQHRLGFLAPGPARTYFVKAIDTSGNASTTASTVTVDVDAPRLQMREPAVAANAVTLRWDSTATTFPITFHEIRKGGADWSAAEALGRSQTESFSFFETSGGTYLYRVKAIDAAGNTSVERVLTVKVGDPTNYVAVAQFEGALT